MVYDVHIVYAHACTQAYANAAVLCSWVRANVSQFQLRKGTGPLLRAIEEQTTKLNELEATLAANAHDLALTKSGLDTMNQELQEIMNTVELLQEDRPTFERLVESLGQLVEHVSPLVGKWQLELAEWHDVRHDWVTVCATTAMLLVYCGTLSASARSELFLFVVNRAIAI